MTQKSFPVTIIGDGRLVNEQIRRGKTRSCKG